VIVRGDRSRFSGSITSSPPRGVYFQGRFRATEKRGGENSVDRVDERFIKVATKDDFKILVDEIRLLRADIKDGLNSIRSLVGMVADHDKAIDAIKDHVGLSE